MKRQLTEAERKTIQTAVAAGTFSEALRLTPENLLEALVDELSSREGEHDLFDTDMFPRDWKMPTPEEQARLEQIAARKYGSAKPTAKKLFRRAGHQ